MAKAKTAPTASEVEENEDVEVVSEESNGQGRIPGTEYKVIGPLVTFGRHREHTKAEHKRLTAELKTQNDDEAPMLFQKYKEYFEETDDAYIYSAGGIEIKMVKGTLTCKTATLDAITL